MVEVLLPAGSTLSGDCLRNLRFRQRANATVLARRCGNQIDRCDAAEMERASSLEPDALFVSATAGLGLQGLRRALRTWPPPVEAE